MVISKYIILIGSLLSVFASVPIDAHSAYSETELEQYSRALCTTMELNYGHEKAGEKVENVMLSEIGIDRSETGSRKAVLAHWNKVNDGLICDISSEFKPNARTPQHFLKRVVDLRMENQIFYEFLFFDSETHPDVDVNAVEMVDGEPETLLDYIDDIFAAGPERQSHYDLQQLAELREMLVEEYGAKTAAELDY